MRLSPTHARRRAQRAVGGPARSQSRRRPSSSPSSPPLRRGRRSLAAPGERAENEASREGAERLVAGGLAQRIVLGLRQRDPDAAALLLLAGFRLPPGSRSRAADLPLALSRHPTRSPWFRLGDTTSPWRGSGFYTLQGRLRRAYDAGPATGKALRWASGLRGCSRFERSDAPAGSGATSLAAGPAGCRALDRLRRSHEPAHALRLQARDPLAARRPCADRRGRDRGGERRG